MENIFETSSVNNNNEASKDNKSASPIKETGILPLDLNKVDKIPMQHCKVLIDSGLLPAWIKRPEQLITAIHYAKELKLPILTALKGMYIVNGIPTLTVSLLTALIRSQGHSFRVVKEYEHIEVDGIKDAVCEIHAYRKDEQWIKDENGNPIHHVIKYTWSEAKYQGLTDKPNWRKMPKAMLKARCISKMARDVFSDVTNGFYTPEEIDSENVIVDEEGNVVEIKR